MDEKYERVLVFRKYEQSLVFVNRESVHVR